MASDKYRPFDSARCFARELGLKSRAEWYKWSKSDDRPNDIPADPAKVYKDEWQGWGDFLGTNYKPTQLREYLPHDAAREFVLALSLKSQKEWREWAKSNNKPATIPADPYSIYKNNGWLSWGHFLGTNFIPNTKRVFKPFNEACEFAKTLGLKGQDEWRQWAKSNRPSDIPSNPDSAYQNEWISWGHFLGTQSIHTHYRDYKSFNDARDMVRALGLPNREAWFKLCKDDNKPSDIPNDPSCVYENIGWSGWGDFLGTDYVASQNRIYRSFKDARNFAVTLNLKGKDDWQKWCKSLTKPIDIPANPHNVYKDEWRGWSYWLGVYNVWNKKTVVEFLKSLMPEIPNLTPAEILCIIQQNGLMDITNPSRRNSNAHLVESLVSLAKSPNNLNLEELSEKYFSPDKNSYSEKSPIDNISEDNNIGNADAPMIDLPEYKINKILEGIDSVASLVRSEDNETINFLITSAVNKIWTIFLENLNLRLSLESLPYKEGKYRNLVKEKFLEEYNNAINLTIPDGYAFHINGNFTEPNLMQKLVAYKIITERSFGNWSGTGAGKTLSAIFASRVIKSKLTVIVALNATLAGWYNEIICAYPDSQVFDLSTMHLLDMHNKHQYLILNYEKFQQKDSLLLVKTLVDNYTIEFVVLDEIQNAKQRGAISSKRRYLIEHLVTEAKLKNPNLCTLGISATPVINNLNEAISLLSMITGEGHNDLGAAPTIENCLNIHKKLMLHGIRYTPHYDIAIDKKEIEICGNHLVDTLRVIKKNDILGMEAALLKTKLEAVKNKITPGTIVYTHYVTGIVNVVEKFVRDQGFSCAAFTGNEKCGLQLFLDGKVDVLIGSSTLGTGLNGLQYVCNKLIILSLPWTYSGYTQLLGRIYRQGSIYKKIEVIIPQVVLQRGTKKWSYDKYRMEKIQFKKTLGDAVLEGVFPDDKILSPKSMFEEVIKSLHLWIESLEVEVAE